MNTETKRHIDAARQVLVGVVPNPTSQIDQITNALIYKFMDDMDQASIKSGGEPSFFVGDLEKYAWTRLMDTKIGNQDRMNLYVEALSKFSESANLPELFRNIFRSAFLPYRSPEVLGLFLKEINYFDYSHPEELGNAYEYLLSIMSSQGDAGQFRTPRHIIDFIVDVVNPTKDEKVLDPACGTGGFLVSAYRRILEQHDGKNDPSKKEKPLTPDDRKNIMNNFEGYDIDPGMVRIAQVNMYLHQFKNPKIYQYDTLSMDERWNDKFDVILANPPFMSPKGGINPHSRFSIQSTRSEVLFVDYIKNHLRPNGRAGIIVPEGIIFQSGTAYKQLRKALVEDGLYAVVSLPSGVFQPYSGVKTSVLLFDNQIAKLRDSILFVKVENDGYTLGATRTKFDKNDLPKAKAILAYYKESGQVLTERVSNAVAYFEGEEIPKITWSDMALLVEKKKIANSGDYNLSKDRYQIKAAHFDTKWPIVNFDEYLSTITPPSKIQKENYKATGKFPIIDQSQVEIAGWTNDSSVLIDEPEPLVIFGDHTCAVKYVDKPFAQGADGIKILKANKLLLPKFFYYILKNKPIISDGYQRHFTKLRRYQFPLPSLEIQEQIVAELDGYQKIIDGAKQVVESWKPIIDIDPSWELKKIMDICTIGDGNHSSKYPKASEMVPEGVAFIRGVNLVDGAISEKDMKFISEEKHKQLKKGHLKTGDVLFTNRGEIGKVAIVDERFNNANLNSQIAWLRSKELILPEYLLVILMSDYIQNKLAHEKQGATLQQFTVRQIEQLEIPVPDMQTQIEIAQQIKLLREVIKGNKLLIKTYTEKIRAKIEKLFYEN